MKKIFRRLAGYVVTAYANRLYKKAVKIADERHANEKTTIYVISSYTDQSVLETYNRDQFRKIKRYFKMKEEKIENLRNGSWYHTADAGEKNGLTPLHKEARRLAFIRMMLTRAKLA
jgi:hypothetical protein